MANHSENKKERRKAKLTQKKQSSELQFFDSSEEELNSLNGFGDFYRCTSNFEKSEIFLKESLILSEKHFGKPPKTGRLSENINF